MQETPRTIPPTASSSFDAPDVDNQLPEQYEILGKIRQGGMGAIYKVRNRYTDKLFAVKILRPDATKDIVAQQRFVNEAKTATVLNHPNICKVHDFGIKNGAPYLVMDWIDGISLEDKLERDGALPLQEFVVIFLQVCDALKHAHANKVVHRDIKPDNIMLTRSPDTGQTIPKIVDFGIAKFISEGEDFAEKRGLTQTGTIVGSPLYMSPEQARGRELDGRTDIYSLGCVMYTAISCSFAFGGDTFVDIIYKHLHDEPPEFDPELNIPPDLRRLIFKAMEKEPKDRYQRIEDLSAALSKVGGGVSLGRIELSSERTKKRQRLISALYFIIGFAVMYGISIALQNLSDGNTTTTHHGSR